MKKFVINKSKVKKYFSSFVPQSVLMLKGYGGGKFVKDLLAGLIVGIIALPLSIALAIASGAPPEAGLVTAAVAGFSAALFSGSRFQVTGPTGAFVIIVFNIIADYTYQGMLIATFMAGVFLLLLAVLKAGKIVNYISKAIIVGFTAGIAVTIFSTQIVDFLSLNLAHTPSEFIDKWIEYFKALNTTNFTALGVGLGSLVLMLLWEKLKIKVPGALIAVILSAVIVVAFKLNIPTIGSKFGDIKMNLNFAFPFGGINVIGLLKPALTIALLAAIESLLSAMAADNMTQTKTNSDAELVSQGVANLVSSCFGGLPATGAIARTSANIKNGAVSPISAMIHAVFILIVGLVLMPLVKFVPLTALAAVLFIVCKNMIEVKEIKKTFKSTPIDIILMLTTFVLTVIFDLVVAIIAGVALSLVLFAINLMIKKVKFKSIKLEIKIEENTVLLSGTLNFLFSTNFLNAVKKHEKFASFDNYSNLIIDKTALHTVDMSGNEAIHKLKTYFENLKKEVVLTDGKAFASPQNEDVADN